MSLFDDDLVEEPIFKLPKPVGKIGAVDQFKRLHGKENLSQYEMHALRTFYSRCLWGKGLFAVVPTLIERSVVVTISDEIKIYQGEEWANPYYPHKEGVPIILGQYSMADNHDEIILYIRNIRTAAKDFKGECKDKLWDLSPNNNCRVKSVDLLLAVFAHELYHAYFHRSKYVKEAEEPLAEFGSLLYMNQYFAEMENAANKILGIHRMIRQKEGIETIKTYSLGAKLFLMAGSEIFDKDCQIIGLIEEYKYADGGSLSSYEAKIKNTIMVNERLIAQTKNHVSE